MAFDLSSKDFLEKLVKQPVSSFEIKAGSNAGDNVQGELKAVKVETGSGETINLVHKTMPPDPMIRGFILEVGTFRIENDFYSRIAPAIETLIKTRNPTDYELPIPKFYAGFNNDSDDYITMEDLRPLGYQMENKYQGLTFEQTSLVLKELGRFHAFTYFFIKHEGEQFYDTVHRGIKHYKMNTPEKEEEGKLIFQSVVDYMIDIISKRRPDFSQKLENKLKGTVPRDVLKKTVDATDVKYFPLIIHGDLWVNNVLFKYDSEAKPVAVKFIDFQLTRRGNVFEELQYFFFTSTTPEFRKEHLTESLGIYYEAFKSTLESIQCPLPIGFTRGFLLDSFNDCMLPAYIYMGFAIPLQLGENPGFKPPDAFASNGDESCKESNQEKPEGGMPGGFNMEDIPLHIRMGMFMKGIRAQLEASPRAIQRLLDITQEMVDRKIL